MQGYQFAHIETWSRKGVAKSDGNDPKVRRNGQRGWTAEQIIDEAAREPWASEHVGRGRREPIVIAGTCASFDELRSAHEEACNATVRVPYTNPKTKKKGTRKRSVRIDTHTLYTSVVSLPITSAEARGDAAQMAECKKAFEMAIGFEKRRLEDAGGEFAMAVVHLDETHVHLHIYGLDRARGSVNGLHPGKAALDAFRARHGVLSSKGSDLYQRSKRAYCDAMREWQDDLHREALGQVGLCRFGPRRFRYSRSQWAKRKREEEERGKAQETIGNLGDIRAAQIAAGEAMAAREENITEMQGSIDAERVTLNKERASVEAKERRLDAGIATIEALSEGFIEMHGDGEETRVDSTEKTKQEKSRWRELRAHLVRAPEEVLRVGKLLARPLRRLRADSVEKGRTAAMAEAREEIASRFPRLGAVHAFARDLIGSLKTSEERQAATDTLDRVARGEASDVNRLRTEGSRSGRNDGPLEQ